MPRDTPCDHRNCYGEPCRQLTPGELEPTERDKEWAGWLISNGYKSVSSKRREVARLNPHVWPGVADLIRPEMRGHPAGVELERLWLRHQGHLLRCYASGNRDQAQYVDVEKLTVRQFRAFKQLGGQSA